MNARLEAVDRYSIEEPRNDRFCVLTCRQSFLCQLTIHSFISLEDDECWDVSLLRLAAG